MKNVTFDVDRNNPGTFLARSNKTGKVIATGGRVDSYNFDRQPVGMFMAPKQLREELPS